MYKLASAVGSGEVTITCPDLSAKQPGNEAARHAEGIERIVQSNDFARELEQIY